MNDVTTLMPLLGALGTFAFCAVVCYGLIQQMRYRDDRANNREDRMMALVENHLVHFQAALEANTVAVKEMAAAANNLGLLVMERTRHDK